jgi:hypothetical protein
MPDDGGPTRVYRRFGRVSHLLPFGYSPNSSLPAICGASPPLGVTWYGTGAQDEIERVEALPTCRKCAPSERQSA